MLTRYSDEYWKICDLYRQDIINVTGCHLPCSFLEYKVSRYYVYIIIYRVSGLSCSEAGGCKSAILRDFPDVFSLFGPCKVGGISFRYSWTTGVCPLPTLMNITLVDLN